MSHLIFKKYKSSFYAGLLLISASVFIPLHAETRTISGIIVDSENRENLDNVTIDLLENGQSRQQLNTDAGSSFSITHDFMEHHDYKLIFSKADYQNHKINLSNVFKSDQQPENMTISMGGEKSSFIFKGKTRNRDTDEAISNVNITTTNLMTGEQSRQKSDLHGNYSIPIISGYEYSVIVEDPDHLKRFAKINYCRDTLEEKNKYCLSGFNDVSLDENGGVSGASVLMDRVEIGKKFRVDNIYYDYNKATLRPDAIPHLRKVLHIMNDNPQITIELGSHADARGSDEYNLKLSQRRAESAVNYIIKEGINESRIKAKGYGETILINHCSNGVRCSDKKHEENRRTEFIIINIDKSRFISQSH